MPLASLQEVAAYLGIPVGTLYGWRYKGEGPSGYKVGKHVRYRWADVDRWLETRKDEERCLSQPGRRAVLPTWLPIVQDDYRPLRRIKERLEDGSELLVCGHTVRGRPNDWAQRRRCPAC